MKIILCTINDEVSARSSVGVGLSNNEAMDDALLHFPDLTKRRTVETIKNRAKFYFEVRAVRALRQ